MRDSSASTSDGITAETEGVVILPLSIPVSSKGKTSNGSQRDVVPLTVAVDRPGSLRAIDEGNDALPIDDIAPQDS